MASVKFRVHACIVTACLMIGGCVDSPVNPDSQQPSAMPNETPAPRFLPVVRSIGDGVFTEEQSRRGESQYLETCKRCHQRDLGGDFVEDSPPLVGDEFLSNWTPWTVGDLFEFMTIEMPPKPKDRRHVTAENYADIIAYILDKNGFPAGPVELPPEFDPLATIEMRLSD